MFTSYGNSGRWQGDEVYTPGLIGLAGECTPLGFHQLMVDELHQALTTSSDPDFSVSLWLHTNEANIFDKVFLFYQEDGALSHSTVSTQAEGTGSPVHGSRKQRGGPGRGRRLQV